MCHPVYSLNLKMQLLYFSSFPQRSFAPLNVLKKLAGVWITGGKNIMFNQGWNSSASFILSSYATKYIYIRIEYNPRLQTVCNFQSVTWILPTRSRRALSRSSARCASISTRSTRTSASFGSAPQTSMTNTWNFQGPLTQNIYGKN